MPDLWSTLGYDDVASVIAEALQASHDINVIQGPPGVGKSWLAKGIGAIWDSSGGSTIVAEGDLLRSEVAFYPLGFAVAGLSSTWRSMGSKLADTTRAGERMAGTFGVITSTIQVLAQLQRKRRRARKMYLGEAEQAILYELERLARKRPLLIIADNLHWWDTASLEFLGRLRDARMSDAFPFLAEMRVIAVRTPEPHQSVVHPTANDALLSAGTTRFVDLRRPPRERFHEVLVALGAPPGITPDSVSAIYALSGGHLALASRCAGRLASGASDAFLVARDPDEFLRALLTERVRSLGVLGVEAVAVLQIAAVLGLTFRRDEVACASGGDDAEISKVLRQCRDQDVLELTDGLGRFVHDLYRQHFLSLAAQDRTGIHERLADCLRVLRPADYRLRCLNAVDAERFREAGALAVQAALQDARDGRSWRALPNAVLEAMRASNLEHVTERLVAALGYLNSYRFADCQVTLDRLPRDLPTSLLAEADYLRSMCLMSTRSEDDRGIGRTILEAWEGFWDAEPELGIRLTQLLLYGLTHLHDKGQGLKLEARLRRVLIARVSFDPAAEDALYTLDRCSGSLHPPDLAVVRNEEAVEHYAPGAGQTVVRRPVEYYRCLVNYGATLICNARYDEARDVYAEVERLVSELPAGVLPRLDYPRMNALLAEYRLGAAIDIAVDRQREIAASMGVDGDPFYIENALAVYLALAGRFDESLAIFSRLYTELTRSRSRPEPSMVYLIRANWCVTRFVGGDTAAHDDWEPLRDVLKRIAYVTRPYLLRRHELLGHVLRGDPIPAAEFDVCLVRPETLEFGPLWDNYGRGFRMPEVEFWREN